MKCAFNNCDSAFSLAGLKIKPHGAFSTYKLHFVMWPKAEEDYVVNRIAGFYKCLLKRIGSILQQKDRWFTDFFKKKETLITLVPMFSSIHPKIINYFWGLTSEKPYHVFPTRISPWIQCSFLVLMLQEEHWYVSRDGHQAGDGYRAQVWWEASEELRVSSMERKRLRGELITL